MLTLPEEVESTFRYILIAGKRAEQLINGARARVVSRHVKPTTLALEELGLGLVPWQRVTAEEYELLRQRESMARDHEEQVPIFAAPVPPVVAAVEPEVEAEGEDEFEEELEGEALDFGEDLEDVEAPGAEELLAEPVEE
jgi:DNA-directed RNA polymerase subunit K/omega